MLAIKSQSWYIIKHNDKKKKQPALLIPTLLFRIVEKKAMHSYN